MLKFLLPLPLLASSACVAPSNRADEFTRYLKPICYKEDRYPWSFRNQAETTQDLFLQVVTPDDISLSLSIEANDSTVPGSISLCTLRTVVDSKKTYRYSIPQKPGSVALALSREKHTPFGTSEITKLNITLLPGMTVCVQTKSPPFSNFVCPLPETLAPQILKLQLSEARLSSRDSAAFLVASSCNSAGFPASILFGPFMLVREVTAVHFEKLTQPGPTGTYN